MRRKAFTLIELLVVIGIIGLIGALVGVGLGTARAKSRDSKRVSDLSTFQKALQLGQGQVGVYPAGNGVVLGTVGVSRTVCAKGMTVKFAPDPSATNCDSDKLYLPEVPAAPAGTPYFYTSTDVASNYRICTVLEIGDPKLNLNPGPVQVDETAGVRNVAACP